MAQAERQPRRIGKRHLALGASAALLVGGTAAGFIGTERATDEAERNNRAIGALEHDYSTKLNRPTEEELDETKAFITSLIAELSTNNPDETANARNVTTTIISNDAEIRTHDKILEREENYQETLKRAIKAAGLNSLDDANIYTLSAGMLAFAAGIFSSSMILADELRRRRNKSEPK